MAMALAVAMPAVSRADALGEAAGSYAVQPDSEIRFHVGQVGGGGIDGRFTRFEGTFRIVGTDVGQSSVTFTIYPESVTTGQARVDDFLKSDAVFYVERSPRIGFRSTSVKRTGENMARIDGMLTARGKTRPASFDVTVLSREASQISFKVEGQILRSLYDMDVGTPIYSNVVKFDMRLTGKR